MNRLDTLDIIEELLDHCRNCKRKCDTINDDCHISVELRKCGKLLEKKKTEPPKRKPYVRLTSEIFLNALELGKTVNQVCEELDITRATYFVWKRKIGMGNVKAQKYSQQDIIKLYEQGMKAVEIERELGCSKTTVTRNLSVYRAEKYAKRDEDIMRLKGEGKSPKEIAESLNITLSAVYQTVHKHKE